MEELSKLKDELRKTRAELGILFEISNAMRTTLKLDEVLYIILTGVTAHMGLGFNRALLFLINEKEGIIEGKMGIGPDTEEEANRIWTLIERDEMDLDDLINGYKSSDKMYDSHFNQQVRNIKVPIKEDHPSILNIGYLEGMPLHLTKETIRNYNNDPVLKILNTEELVVVPLKAKDKVNALVLADNIYTKKPINKDDLRMLIMLSNQAGLAIENSQLYEQTLVKSHSDSLTGLWNHGYFQYLLQSEAEKAKATNLPLSLIMIDMDDFKKYNDTYGHPSGDTVLQGLAKLFLWKIRTTDFVARYGGEEFAIIAPHTDKKNASVLAARLVDMVSKQIFSLGDSATTNITISVGLATFNQDAETKEDLIQKADQALYQAKSAGRDCAKEFAGF